MEFWKGKVAVVTGANSGMGHAVAKDLLKNGVIVFGLDVNLDKLQKLKEESPNILLYPVQCDLTAEEQIQTAFDYVEKKGGGVDIMVNCAGIASPTSLLDKGNMDILTKTINTNLVGLISCTKKAYESMDARGTPGYIINISSTSGRSVLNIPGKPRMNSYAPSKHGVTALNTVLRHELNYFQKPHIRVSNITPGATRTEIGANMAHSKVPMLEPEDISSAVLYLLGQRPRVQIEDIIIRPTGDLF